MQGERIQTALEVLLGPVLLLQGRRVRRDTPRLPEPAGPRAGGGGGLRLLVVGDSSGAGVGAERWEDGLTARLVEALGGPGVVSWRLVAKTGWSTPRAAQALASERDVADVAVVALGVNDVTARTPLRSAVADHLALIEDLRTRLGCGRIVVTAVPPMHLFTALPWPLRPVLGRRARCLDAALARAVSEKPEVTRVEVPLSSAEGMLATDGFHPGPRAYALWAEAVAPLVSAPQDGR